MQSTGIKPLTVKELLAELEDIWSKFDQQYSPLSAADWNRKYGKDWVFADQPFHMGYIDGMVAENITKGRDLPPDKQVLVKNVTEMNEWNAAYFATRPAGQSGPQALEQWRKTRDLIRQVAAKMTEADLAKPVWFPLFMGWATAGDLLYFSLVHAVGEYVELMLRRGKSGPLPSAVATRLREGLMVNFMPVMIDREAAKDKDFKAVWTFKDSRASWTLHIKDGAATVQEGRAPQRDVEIKTDLVGFEKVTRKMGNPLMMMLTGQFRVSGMSKMGTFQKLMPPPK